MKSNKKYVKWVILWGILFWVPFIAGANEQELPALPIVTIGSLFGIIAFTMNDKGHGKINNLFWGAFANIAGLIYVGSRGYKKGSSAYKQKVNAEKERRNQLAKQHAKQKAAIRNAEIERKKQYTKAATGLKKKYGNEDATRALAGKIWVNMPFELYREAQAIRPEGRKFGKKFENVVNGEERHKYRFDPYENRQGKTSYNYEIDTKAGLITGWKNLEDN